MANKNEIKRKALEKLDELVLTELKRLEDGGFQLEDFNLNVQEKDFSEEEKHEIENSIHHVHVHLKCYCKYRGIESTLLTEQNN